MYNDHYDLIAEFQMKEDFIEKEMHTQKGKALQTLSSIVVHSSDIEAFANILSYAWFDSVPDAQRLADKLNLYKLDFVAINEDLESFKEEFFKEKEAQNF